MLKFISALDSDRATTDTLTATIIRIVITIGPIGVTPITGRTPGMADIDITATIVTSVITDKVTQISEIQTEAGSKAISSQRHF